jgi:hypothetical protein
MQHPAFRTLENLERQMAAARQLRSDTMLRGIRRVIDAMVRLPARLAARWRGDQSLAASWLLERPQHRPNH